MMLLLVAFDPIIFFSDFSVVENNGVSPEEVFKMEGAGGNVVTFI
jgi:hypothetical protein